MEPKGTEMEPKGTEMEPKWNRNGTEMEPKGTKRNQKWEPLCDREAPISYHLTLVPCFCLSHALSGILVQ